MLWLIVCESGKELKVGIEEAAAGHISRLCAANSACETGGILIGSYSESHPVAVVTEVSDPPPDSSATKNKFQRGKVGLQELLSKRWDTDPRTYYVGEWHFHTENVPAPSSQDLKQMRAISRNSKYDCANPILIIVTPGENKEVIFNVYIFLKGQLARLRLIQGRCE